MKQHTQTTLLALYISLLLSSFPVNSDTSKTTNSAVEYYYYESPNDPDGQKYHSFLPAPAPEGLFYDTRVHASANIDDTPEKESVVLIVAATSRDVFSSNWVQMFLLITEAETEEGLPNQKALFKLFDSGTHALEVPAAKSIELQSPAFVFTKPPKDSLKSRAATFKLVDLTGNGTLDIWVEFGYAVAVISFQDGEFKVVFSCYTVPGLLPNAAYVDLDNDGTCEIKIPYSIHVDEVPGAPDLPWVSLYEWDGTDYVLNNRKFYADNNEFLIRLLNEYNYMLLRHGSIINLCETYKFYLGLVHYYRRSKITFSSATNQLIYHHVLDKIPSELQWILEHGQNQDYIQAIKSISKSPPLQE